MRAMVDVIDSFEFLMAGWATVVVAGGTFMKSSPRREELPTIFAEKCTSAWELLVDHGKGIPVNCVEDRLGPVESFTIVLPKRTDVVVEANRGF